MQKQKLFAGTKLRETRRKLGITQKEFAQKLGISLPYLNQMENNNRPLSAGVVLALAQVFGMDVTELSGGDTARLVSDLAEAVGDPVFTDDPPPLSDLRMAANNVPSFVRAFLDLHRAYRETQDQLALLDEALGRDRTNLSQSPWEEVRDFFHYCNNYIDAIDHAAERFSNEETDVIQTAHNRLNQQGITICDETGPKLRHYDPDRKVLSLSTQAPRATRHFQLLIQIALITQNDLLEATLDLARFQTDTARQIAKMGLANYFAGAALMPYDKFQTAAFETRHDLERLSDMFGASIEQVAHRLSTLQRPGAKGIPFFFVRVDQAGTITKRHSATSLQFARFGGACPLWNVHQAFETPGRFLRQLAQTPDGRRYFCLARDVTKRAGTWGAPVRRYAIGLGCEIQHAGALVYADHMETDNAQAFEPIGISCRICERMNCHQRSVPPLERHLEIDPNQRETLPYQVG